MWKLIEALKNAEIRLEKFGSEYLGLLKESGFLTIEELWVSNCPINKKRSVTAAFLNYQNAKNEADRIASKAESELKKAELKLLRRELKDGKF